MTQFRKSVAKPAPGAGAPKGKNANATVVWVEDIEFFPPTNEYGVLLLGNIALKSGARMERIYMTDSTQKASHKYEGDPDAGGLMKVYEGSHPGDEIEINEFIQNSLEEPFIIITDVDCDSGMRKVYGLKCNPLYLKPEFVSDNTGIKHTLMFEQRLRDRHVAKFYQGELSFAENFEIVDPTATQLTVANGFVYEVPANTAGDVLAITAMTIPHKKVVTLVGKGGTDPVVFNAAVFASIATVILDNGTPWIATKGAVLNLEVFDAGTVIYLKEVSRK